MNHPLLTTERTAQEVDFIESSLLLSPFARILDVGCGFGRHSIELARRGYDVVGIDPSPAMIAAAQEKAERAGVKIDFRREHGEMFVTKTLFYAAICLFTSLGQIGDHGSNCELVSRVHAALNPGGQFLVEVPQRDTAVRQLKLSETYGGGQSYTAVTRHFDPATQILSEQFRLVSPGNSRSYYLQVRLYDRQELFTLLEQAGFSILSAYGDYSGRPLTDDDAVMLVQGQKK